MVKGITTWLNKMIDFIFYLNSLPMLDFNNTYDETML